VGGPRAGAWPRDDFGVGTGFPKGCRELLNHVINGGIWVGLYFSDDVFQFCLESLCEDVLVFCEKLS
jgi:hypothetical protein